MDLLLQTAKEVEAGILLVTERNYIPQNPNWVVSKDGNAAIYFDLNEIRLRCQAFSGNNFVAIHCETFLFVSIYISPNICLRDYNTVLNNLSDVLGNRTDKIIIGGDFNAKSQLWGALRTNGKGSLLAR